jgi:predicted DNA-binding transcriptional regulator AlpA
MKTKPIQPVAHGRAIRLPRVMEICAASRATIWRWSRSDKSFPRPFKLSAGISAWDESEVFAWLEAKKSGRAA